MQEGLPMFVISLSLLSLSLTCHDVFSPTHTVFLPSPLFLSLLFPSLSLSLSVSFPHPSSPLLDVEVIIGDDAKLASLVSAFNTAVSSDAYTPWPSLEWFTKE